MNFNLQINLDNAAFNGDYLAREYEIEEVLHHIGIQIFAGHTNRQIIDSNGKKCGHYEIVEG